MALAMTVGASKIKLMTRNALASMDNETNVTDTRVTEPAVKSADKKGSP